MRIVEISPAQVRDWVPRAVERMAQVRVASGALRKELVNDFIARKTALFRVGVPRNSKVFVSDESPDWMWMRVGNEPEIIGSHVTGDLEPWIEVIRENSHGASVALTAFEGEQGLPAAATREISQRMMVPINEIHIQRTYDDVHVRGMTSAELDHFLDVSTDASDRLLDLAVGGCESRADWDVILRAKSRLSDGVATPGHVLMSICVDTTVVGGIWAEVDGKNARIWDVLVFPPYRGHNHSQSALVAMADGLKAEGVRYLHVTVITPNLRALEIYRAVGFKVTARHLVIEE